MRTHGISRILLVGLLASTSITSWADGLTDLKNAIAKLDDQTPFHAQIDAQINSTNTEGDNKVVKEGSTSFEIQQNENGLQVQYNKTLLQQIDNETQLKKKEPKAKTPITEAMNRFNYSELSTMLYPLRALEQDLNKAVFKREEQVTYQDKPARLLHFNIPIESLSDEERKNLKRYKTHLKIWIDENGVPLASHSVGKGSGRFMVVISFEFHSDVYKSYGKIGNRLLTTQLTNSSGGGGAGMRGDETIKASLTLLP